MSHDHYESFQSNKIRNPNDLPNLTVNELGIQEQRNTK